jgi:hypothetical protein
MDIETRITNAKISETHVVIGLLDLKIYIVTHACVFHIFLKIM